MDKAVLITGGSRGIGAETVKEFIARGYDVVFFYEKDEKSAKIVEEKTGATGIKCDLRKPAEVKKAVKDGKVLLGINHFDVLVCNAGISITGLFTDLTLEQWEDILGVNLNGMIYTIKEVLPEMIGEKAGSIILLSSMWGQTGASCEVAYSTTKAAVIGLTKSLAKEVGPSGIRINCIAPGVIDTDMNKQFSVETIKELEEEIPLGRIGTSSEVAKAIGFLASEEARYITGQIIGVNGGFII